MKGEFRVSGAGSDVRLYLLRKLYFDFVKVIFWLSAKLYFGFQPKLRYLSITCPQGKYHCNAISLSKTISLRKQYLAEGISLHKQQGALPGDSHVALLLRMTSYDILKNPPLFGFWKPLFSKTKAPKRVL